VTGATARRATCAWGAPQERPLQVPQGRPPADHRQHRAQPRSRPRGSLGALDAEGEQEGHRRRSRRQREPPHVIRNCRDHQFLPPEGVNVFDLLRHDTLIGLEGRRQGSRSALPSHEGDRPMRPDDVLRAPSFSPRSQPPPREEPGRLRGVPRRQQSADQRRIQAMVQRQGHRREHARDARQGQAHGRGYSKLQNWKKAIITLKEGDSHRLLRR